LQGPDTTIFPLPENPHIALNASLAGNRIRSRASAAIFPNYFMPLGWPTPAAVTIHDVSFITHPQFYSRKMRWWYTSRIRHTVNNASLILTVSEASKSLINKHLGISRDRIMVHPPTPARELNARNYPSSPHPRPYLLYIGNLEPKKNILNMLEAFEMAHAPEFDLILIGKIHAGTPEWRNKLQSTIDANPRIHHAGYLEARLRDNYLCNAAGLLQCSHVEGFGITLLDAQANGIPVIISRDTAMQEVSGGFALTVDETRPTAIADGISALIADRDPSTRPCVKLAHSHAINTYAHIRINENLHEITDRLLRHQHVAFPYGNYAATGTFVKSARNNEIFEKPNVSCTTRAINRRDASAGFEINTPKQSSIPHEASNEQHAITSAIAYSAVFGGPVGIDKLHQSVPFQPIQRDRFDEVLQHVLLSLFPLVRKRGVQLHFTPLIRAWRGDRDSDESTVEVRPRRGAGHTLRTKHASHTRGDKYSVTTHVTDNEFTEEACIIRKRHHTLLRRLGSLPWIKALYYSGGTAHQQSGTPREDLDIFVVAARNRVWLAWLSTKLLGGTSTTTRLCANYLVDEDAQEITWQQDFYTAHQLLFLRQIVRKPGVQHIREANDFVYEYFPNVPRFTSEQASRNLEKTGTDINSPSGARDINRASSARGKGIITRIGSAINTCIFALTHLWWKTTHRNSGYGGMLWDLHRIKLHTNDHRPAIYKRYSQLLHQCEELTGSPERDQRRRASQKYYQNV
ncbi:MAG: glycosyltransferase family 4 protein, partial [Balneolales bacterium]|nr:glycosyltransferase family 4 protein [Balneolales bacterium]